MVFKRVLLYVRHLASIIIHNTFLCRFSVGGYRFRYPVLILFIFLSLSESKNLFLVNPGDNVSGSRRLLDCLVTLEDIVRKAGIFHQQKHLCFDGTLCLIKYFDLVKYLQFKIFWI